MLKRNLPMLLIHSWIIHFWCMVSQFGSIHIWSPVCQTSINIEWIWDGRTRNLYLGSSVGPPSPVDSISERTRSTSYSERRPSSSQFQELSFNTMTVHFRKAVHSENVHLEILNLNFSVLILAVRGSLVLKTLSLLVHYFLITDRYVTGKWYSLSCNLCNFN